MAKRIGILCIILGMWLVTCTAFAWKPKMIDAGEAIVQVGDVWQVNTPADFDASDYDMVEQQGVNGILFTKTGDVTVTAVYWDRTSPIKQIAYSKVKRFHVVPSPKKGSSIQLSKPQNTYAKDFLEKVNAYRAAKGLEPVRLDDTLCRIAEERAKQESVAHNALFILHKKSIVEQEKRNYAILEEFVCGGSGLGMKYACVPLNFIEPGTVFYSEDTAKREMQHILNPSIQQIGFGFTYPIHESSTQWWVVLYARK